MGGRSIPPDDEGETHYYGDGCSDEHGGIGSDPIHAAYLPKAEVRATSSTGGEKGRKPEEYALIPVGPLAEVARVYGYGASKYSAQNWRSGYPYTWSLSALQRHIEAFRRGESHDLESGLHHLAHASFHLNTLMWFDMNSKGEDDRGDVA